MQMSHSISAKMAQILLASFCVCYTGGLSCKPTATVITYPASFCKKNAIISSKKKDCWKNNLQCFIKFIHSEKVTNVCEISTMDLFYVVTVKSTVEISQNFVAFSEYMNFKVLDFSFTYNTTYTKVI